MLSTLLLELVSGTTFLIYAIAAILGWIIFYYTIKWAVKNAIIEARTDIELSSSVVNRTEVIEKPYTNKQKTLQERYDAGEISFEEYKSEWDKL